MLRVSKRAVAGILATVAAAALVAGCVSEKTPAASSASAAPAFTRKPAVAAEENAIRITFAVDRETDVAVAVLDAHGRVVRHLAAGMLGKNAPAPLAAGNLEQSLVWDRTDDDGTPVPPGRYRAEVRLGLRAGATRPLGWDSRALGTVYGMAAGPGRSLYVMSEGGYGFCRVLLLGRDGRYVRTLVPRSAGLPLDRAVPLGEIVLNDGQRVPRELLPEFGSASRQSPVVTAAGDIIFVNGRGPGHPEGHRYSSSDRGKSPKRRLLRLAADGGVPAAGYLGPVLGQGFEKGDLFLALGPDGETVYISGARHAVFALKWGADQKPAAVAGTPDAPGAKEKNLKDPQGIALDSAGNLYVADRGNHRVAAFDARGKFLGQIDVQWPQQVLVDSKATSVYVTAGYHNLRLLKFAGNADKQPVAEIDLHSSNAVVAIDVSPSALTGAVIFAANVGRDGGRAMIRLYDSGRGFQEIGGAARAARPLSPFLMGADRRNEMLYCYPHGSVSGGYARIDGRIGRREPVDILLHPKANLVSEITAAPNGTVAAHVKSEFGRLDQGLRPLPFASSGTHIARFPDEDCPRSNYDRGCTVAPSGDIYWIHERGGYAKFMRCSALKADGSVKKDTLIFFESGSPAGIRVDRKGCIYVLDHLKPIGQLLPEALAGKVPNERYSRYMYNYGSVMKFGPDGGKVRMVSKRDPGPPATNAFTTAEGRGRFEVDGLLWSRFGVSMIQPPLDRSADSPYCCQCWAPRFDLDGFERLFVPDQLRCAVEVLDSNGNKLLRLGGYGNADDRGVALADPRTVMVTDEAAYVGDTANGRILRIELACAARADCAVEVKGTPPAKPVSGLVYRAGDPEPQRLSAVWSFWEAKAGSAERTALRSALTDKSEAVRAAAAYVLVHAGDVAGLAEVFRAARSKNPDVYKLAETSVLKDVVRWDANNELARMIDPNSPLAARFPMGKEEVEALAPLVEAPEWYLNRAAIFLLGQSGRPEAGTPLLAKLRGGLKGKNLNRVIGALGVLRFREAAPEIVKYLARGRDPVYGTEEYNGDVAERAAASALARIGDPAAVPTVIALLDGDKVNTPAEALRCLSVMFRPALAGDLRLVPKDGALAEVRVDALPPAGAIKSAWQAFWKTSGDKYEPNPESPGLRAKGGK